MLGLVKKISVGICGDAKASAEALLHRLKGMSLASDINKKDRATKIAIAKKEWEQELDEWIHETDDFSKEAIKKAGEGYLHPRQVLRELEKAMPKDVMVSTDIGNINSVANSYLRFEKPRSCVVFQNVDNCWQRN